MRIGKNIRFAQRMQQAMQKKNLRNADIQRLSKELGNELSSSAIAQYKTGIYLPKADKLATLALVLDVTEKWLLGKEEHELTLTEQEKQLILAYRQIKNEDKQFLYNLVKKLNIKHNS